MFDDRLGRIWEPKSNALDNIVLQNNVDRRDRPGDDQRLKLSSIVCRLFFAQCFEADAACQSFEACFTDEAFLLLHTIISFC